MSDRQTRTVSTAAAECQDCDWRSDLPNAHGCAARHHDRHGHLVEVHVVTDVTYGNPARALPGQMDIGCEGGERAA